MNFTFMHAVYIYGAAICLLSIIVTVVDKRHAIVRTRRVPEATLLLLSALGGSAAMYLTMLFIRHKTRKLKFMVGIPLIVVLQGAGLFGIWYVMRVT